MASPTHPSPSQTGRELGKFENGKWYCILLILSPACLGVLLLIPSFIGCCNLEAAFHQVKKEGPNKGRRFHRCPKWGDQCRFYLYEDEAKEREQRASHQNSALNTTGAGNPSLTDRRRRGSPESEAASTVTEGPIYSPASGGFHTPASRHRSFLRTPRLPDPDWSSDEDSSATADGRRQPDLNRYAGPPTPTPKRTRPEAEGRDAGVDAGGPATDTEFSEIDADIAEELTEIADMGEAANQRRQVQPRPSQRSDLPATPSGRGTHAGFAGPQTPAFTSLASGTTIVPTPEPGSKRRKTTQGFATLTSTPTASRTQNALAGSQDQNDAEMTTAMLNLLRPERISASTREAVREMLNEADRQYTRRIRTAEAQLAFARDTVEEKKAEISRLVRENAMQQMEISGLKDQVQAFEKTSGIVAALYRNDDHGDN
ncbi:hypothetical protein C8A03DRAFT_11926 [Achaetomium macrosporum]|uniref:GRF-type domain-containing protein n=1 Tax=Achaetomium macrosporum TaxID=79813 RepID=A0AAN7HE72_9PEZI|nr:hypothetical protein C8A03DRAFT_11926 [Achaetomium macrosporum]